MLFGNKKTELPSAEQALSGRETPMQLTNEHFVNQHPIQPPFAQNLQTALFGMGCFWGAERKFWQINGVYSTAVGYSAGFTPNPSYEEVCSGQTGHNEVVLVVFDPQIVSYLQLLKTFWENHNPTQGMRQGNDRGTQYRSGIYTFSGEQHKLAMQSLRAYQKDLHDAGHGDITTEVKEAMPFYYAEQYHQQYLAKNPNGYCGLGGIGICMSD